MTHSQESKHGNGHFPYCGTHMVHNQHACGSGFGIMLILVGAILLVSKTGWLDPELFWPVFFLGAGAVILILNLVRQRKFKASYPNTEV